MNPQAINLEKRCYRDEPLTRRGLLLEVYRPLALPVVVPSPQDQIIVGQESKQIWPPLFFLNLLNIGAHSFLSTSFFLQQKILNYENKNEIHQKKLLFFYK